MEAEYASDCVYRAKIQVSHPRSVCGCLMIMQAQPYLQDLKCKYSQLRRTRGDGNCFFRAFAFAYMEKLLQDSSDLQRWLLVTDPHCASVVIRFPCRFLEMVTRTRDVLLGMGYPQFTLEDFHDTVSLCSRIGDLSTVTIVHVQFVDAVESISNPDTTVESLLKVYSHVQSGWVDSCTEYIHTDLSRPGHI